MADYSKMSQAEIIQLLLNSPQYSNINLAPESFFDGSPVYGLSPWGMPISPYTTMTRDDGSYDPNGEYGFKIPLTGEFDPAQEGGKYGRYIGKYSPDGKLIDVVFEPIDRHGGYISENLDWIGPLVVGGAAALGGGMLGSAMGATEAAGAAPISASQISNLGPAATYADSLSYLTGVGGFTPAQAAQLLTEGATDVLSGAPGLAPAASAADLAPWITTNPAVAGAIPGAPITPSLPSYTAPPGAANAAGAAAGTAAANAAGAAGTGGTLAELAKAAGPSVINAIANGVAGNQIKNDLFDYANEVKDTYTPGLDYLKSKGGTFTPYAIRSPFSSVDNAGNADVSSVYQDILSKSNPVAASSFAAAGNFDYDQAAQDEYDLMMQIMQPDLDRQQLQTEARMAKQGRLGINEAPELNALEKAQNDLRLKAMLQSRATALDRRGSMIQQGTQAMAPTLSVWQGLQRDQALANQTGISAGQLANQANSTWADMFNEANKAALGAKMYGVAAQAGATNAAGNAIGAIAQPVWNWIFSPSTNKA